MALDKENADLNKALPEPGISSQFGLSFARGLPSDPGFRARYSGSTEESVDGIPAYMIRQAQNYSEQSLLDFDAFGSGDPVKFNPSNPLDEDTAMTAEATYKEIANSNPYQPTRCTTIDELIKGYEANVKKSSNNVAQPPPKFQLQHKPKGMSKSFSENNMAKRKPTTQVPRIGKDIYEAEQWVHDLYEGTPWEPGQPRLLSRSPSPNRLDHIKEYHPMGATEPITPPKRSRSPIKQLFSGKGPLGRSTSMNELPDEDHRKKGMKHWGEKIKQRVGGMTEDMTKRIRDSPSKSPPYISKFPVSLDPPTQAKLYSDMELMICATANRFLMVQKCEGRISLESLTKIMQFWQSKNRPQVIEFMFDQATQRDLVLYNLKTVRFYGPSAEEPVKMSIMMQAWRTLAKEMGVRTFCTPDSVIRKHMFDLYKILEMLGAPMVTFMAFQEIQVRTLAAMREAQKKRDEYQAIKFGVERKWEPPLGFDSKVDSTGQTLENPFDKY
ncbi:MAG: hypothetical protein LQ351_002590 [Letrouitia transgressa]|nr:MAG: hypothetical protein LQ351_002590 [Letrouitia transgressa]